MPIPKVIRTNQELRQWRRSLSPNQSVGFVPTMGALHRGHAELLKAARARCQTTVLSIFVNPTQFGPNEDLARYPRTFDADLSVAQACGVDVIFAPTPEEIYPRGYSTFVEESHASEPLCGRFRPGHFRGVTTVVLKLFNLIRPTLALFGLKDAQQYFVLKKMAQDLNLDLEIEGHPTVREPDGLALSSRNAYLSPELRQRAPMFYQALLATQDQLKSGAPVGSVIEKATGELLAKGFRVQYLELRELPDLSEVDPTLGLAPRAPAETDRPRYLLAGAVYLGETRLIDNLMLSY